jgi:hypothetical protein
VFHVHGTSGTTGRPTAFAIGRNDWRAIANAHARILWAIGVRPGDMVCIAAVFSLYMGSWGTLAGAERLGAKAFPFGAGAPGMTARCAQWLALMRPSAFYGTPTYALHLAQVAADEGLNPRDFGLKHMIFSGEPGASIPGVRDKIEHLYGAKVFDSGSMAEMTPWMNVAGTAQTPGLLCWQDVVYTEVCDPETHTRVPYGQRGTPDLHPSGAHLAADDPHGLGRPHPLGRRRSPVRAHLPMAARRHLRAHRRHVHGARRERLSERDRRRPQRHSRLRRRAPDHHHARRRHGRTRPQGRARCRHKRQCVQARGVPQRGRPPAAEDAGLAHRRRRGGARQPAAHRLQGPPRGRRPRRVQADARPVDQES